MRIVLCYPVAPRHIQQIQEAAPEFEVVDAGQERIAAELPSADIFIGHAKTPVPWPEVVAAGRLKWIQSSAAGLDHCLTPEVVASDIAVTSASGLFANQVAEQTMALLLGLVRKLPTFFRAQQARQFVRRPTGDLHGATVGIVGFGGNGRRVAEVLAPWNVRLLATDMFPLARLARRAPPQIEAVWPADQLPRLLSESDVVVLCLPLNADTTGLLDASRLRMMRRGSILINVARGPIVVERDLVAALQDGHLGGAGLDVTEVEPLAEESPLWELPQALITPHVGAQSARRVDVTTDFACDNLRRFLTGQPLRNLVDKQLGFPRHLE